MRIGIVAEGRADQAVISNILKGILGIEQESIQFIRPEFYLDETDSHHQRPEQWSNCASVRDECRNRTSIKKFLTSPVDDGDGCRLLVVHVDTAEIGRADAAIDVARPERPANAPRPQRAQQRRKTRRPDLQAEQTRYTEALVAAVRAKIEEWLGDELVKAACLAIAVEEMEAWVLTLYVDIVTDFLSDPKKALDDWLNAPNNLTPKERKRHFQLPEYYQHDELSKGFRREKTLMQACTRNRSLSLFVDSVTAYSEQAESCRTPA